MEVRTRMAGAIVLAVVVTLLAGCGLGQKSAQNPFSALVDAVTADDDNGYGNSSGDYDNDDHDYDHDHDYSCGSRDPSSGSGDSGFSSGDYAGVDGGHGDDCADDGSGDWRASEGDGSGGEYNVTYIEGVPERYVLPVYPDWEPEQFMEIENAGQIGWIGSFVLTGDVKTVAEKYVKDLKAMGLKVSTTSSGSGEDYFNFVNIEGKFQGRVFRGSVTFGYGPVLHVNFAEPYAMYSEGHG